MTEVDILLLGLGGAGKTTFINSLRETDLTVREDADEGGDTDEVYVIGNVRPGLTRTYKVYVYDGVGIDRSFKNEVLMCRDRIPITRPLPHSENIYPNMYILNAPPGSPIHSAADSRIEELRSAFPNCAFLGVHGDVSDTEDALRIWNNIVEHVA